jgi:O-antigen/teichoic acid export membrane protein
MKRDSKNVTPEKTLQKKIIRGSVWTLAGYGASQVLRLAGNLVLTRLLTPDAFGLMALVQTFLTGLQMFSDFGIFPSIVQSQRGDNLNFLNTAWTIQVIRGGVLWIGSCLLAVPIAHFYNEPMLVQLLPVTGFTAVIGGLASTKLATAHRRLAIKELTLLELVMGGVSTLVTVVAALLFQSVWALVYGNVLGSVIRTLASHWWLKGERNRLCWDLEAVQEVKTFGRWIFISTIIAFFALQGDRLLFGRLLDVRFLGIYTIALALSGLVEQVVEQVNKKVLFPTYSELIRERPQDLYRSLRKARAALLILSSGCAIFFVLGGNILIDFLYDDRYLEAGWILRVLAIGFLGRVLSVTYEDVLMARGMTFTTMILTLTGICIQFVSIFVGYQWAGYHGVIIGIAATDWLTHIAYGICFARLSLWQPELDLPLSVLGAGLGAWVYYF